MKKMLAALGLFLLFVMVPGMDVLAETRITPINEPQVEEKHEISIPDNELSQKYLQEYEVMQSREHWFFAGAVLFYVLIFAMLFINTLLGSTKLFSHQTPISIAVIVASVIALTGIGTFFDELESRELLYKTSLIEEVSEAYVKDNGELPIQGEYQGAGESNLLYALNIEEMAEYELSLAKMDLSNFLIEDETGDIYYKDGKKFIKK